MYYNEEAVGEEYSKWGMEFTFRVKPYVADGDEDPFWVIQLMNNLARFVNETKVWFNEYQFLPLGGPIRSDSDTDICGLAFVKDVDLGEIDTPHGKVIFMQMVGLTSVQLKRLEENAAKEEVMSVIDEIKADNPKFICQL